ncbi:hypothetical protein VM1G_10426 [Cytospora mali]|uniref:Uncharacterized protein n=1 Tax=Cytospora mali TaxID=578113 RepID=A0A194VII8_CYTMA|nr:hypothetical protein VM1G_10426 [Valsa mali]
MQDQDEIGTVVDGPNAAAGTSRPIEDVIGSVFLRLLAGTQCQAQRSLPSEAHAVQCFVEDVRRRKAQPHGTYDDLLDLVATAAARVLVYGVDSNDEGRKDPASLTLYRKMRWLVKRAWSGTIPPAADQHEPTKDDDDDDDATAEFEAIERQELLNEAYDSGYSVGFEAGIRAEAARDRQRSTQTSYTEGFAAGQRAEQDRVRVYLHEMASRTGHSMVFPGSFPEPTPPWSQPPQHSGASLWNGQPSGEDMPFIHTNPIQQLATEPGQPGPAPEAPLLRPETRPRHEGDSRHAIVTCVFCGQEVTANSLLRHKKRRHAAELAAAGVELPRFPCWWPGCGMLSDNLVQNQLTTHMQRKHNCTPPGDPNGFTENVKYLQRMPKDVALGIISEAAQELNAVKERIKSIEAQLRLQNPSYNSQHGLPNINRLHETRISVLNSMLLDRTVLPVAVQELRQLARARGMRSQIRHDEGSWWEVADDLEAALNPSGALAQAVAALPPPDEGPSVPMASGTLVDGPNMKDPNWEPQYSPLFQSNWKEPAPGEEEEDLDGVIVPPDATIRRTKFEIVIPSFSRSVSTAQDQRENEETEGFQRLMAEIEQRVVDDTPQVDWDEKGYDEAEETDVVEDNEALHTDVPSKRPSSQQRKRPGPTGPMHGHIKRKKTSQTE